MLVAQITDLHLSAPEDGPCPNINRFKAVLSELKAMTVKPDRVLITGDLAEHGCLSAYQALKATLTDFNIPVHFALGNHDDKDSFAACFPDHPLNDSFLQYSLNTEALRIIILDTSDPNRHGGAFCKRRANWLEAELAKAPDHPTLIAMHHPPTDIGIPWITTPNEAVWAQRFLQIIDHHDNIVHIICGHIHRTIFKTFAGTTLSVANAIAPQVTLNLSKINPDKVDGRVLIEEAAPGYALHHWDGQSITTHNAILRSRALVKYDDAHAHIIRETMDRS